MIGRARTAEEIQAEFGDAVSRQGGERDELIDAIMGYGTRKAAGVARTARDEEVLRAILSGGTTRRFCDAPVARQCAEGRCTGRLFVPVVNAAALI
jgi:hypothetical protein